MKNEDALAYRPHLTEELRDFIAERILKRFDSLKLMKRNLVVLDQNVFRDLLSQAFDDAVEAGFITADLKFGCGVTLFLDDDFYTLVRRRTVKDLQLPL